MAFSRTCCDNQPIGAMRLETKPCGDPTRISTNMANLTEPEFNPRDNEATYRIANFYPAEREWLDTGCRDDFDPQYVALDTEDSRGGTGPWMKTEFEIQTSSGVL